MPIHLKLLLACVFWGATPTIGRTLSGYEAPFVVVFARFFVAAVFLFAFVRAAAAWAPIPRRHWPRFALLGATGVLLHNGLLFKGLEFVEANEASILLGLIASFVLLLDFAVFRRVPDSLALLGVSLGALGTATVLTGGHLGQLFELRLGLGEGLVLLSALSWAVYTVAGRDLLARYSPLLVTALASWIGLALLSPALFAKPAAALAIALDPAALALVFLLGSLGSALGFLWYYEAVATVGPVGAALYMNLVPVFGLVWAGFALGEPLGAPVLVGGALVFVGLMLVNRPRFLGSSEAPPQAVAEGDRAH